MRTAAVLSALLVFAPASHAGDVDRPISIRVRWDREAGTVGSDALRDDFARAIVSAIAFRGCYGEVRPADAPAPITLDVALSGLEEELRYDDSMAERLAPGEPSKELRQRAEFRIFAHWTLRAGDAVYREDTFRVERIVRPRILGEDPAVTAREEALDWVGREVARRACKVAGPKLLKALAPSR